MSKRLQRVTVWLDYRGTLVPQVKGGATIGESTAPSQHTINYDALLSTTLFAYRDQLYDNIFKDSAFLAALREMNGVDTQDGGERIAAPLLFGTNKTVKSYSGYDTLDTEIWCAA